MSATGRGGERIDSDFYPTPAWCTKRILEALQSDHGIFSDHSGLHKQSGRSWLEPCAGDGAIINVLSDWTQGSRIDGGDVRDLPKPAGCDGFWSVVPYTEWGSKRYGVITNPPFSLAHEIIKHFRPRCDWLVLLLRSSFKLTNLRNDMPDEYRLPQRPEFIASEKCDGVREGKSRFSELGYQKPCGWAQKVPMSAARLRRCPDCDGNVQRSTTDASEYSWFVFPPTRNRSAGELRVLRDTPLEERVTDRGAANS